MSKIKLNLGQERLYFLNTSLGPNAAYNLPLAYEIKGSLSFSTLKDSIQKLGEKHPILRTRLQCDEDAFYFKVTDETLFLDYDRLEYSEVHHHIQKIATQPFDLLQDSPARFKLIEVSKGHFFLCITLHHIIGDAQSLRCILSDIANFYSQNDKDFPIDPIWGDMNAGKDYKQEDLTWWAERISPHSLQIAHDFQRPAEFTFQGDAIKFSIGEGYEKEIKTFCKELRVTENIFFLSLFAFLLKYYGQEKDLNIGIPFSFRSEEQKNALGFFINTLPLPIKMSSTSHISEWIKDLQLFFWEALEKASVPFSEIAATIKKVRDLSRTPVYQTMFLYQTFTVEDFSLPDLETKYFFSNLKCTQCDLLLSIEKTQHGWSCFFEYNTDIWQSSSIELMVEKYQTILKHVLKDYNSPFSSQKIFITLRTRKFGKLAGWRPCLYSKSINAIEARGFFYS